MWKLAVKDGVYVLKFVVGLLDTNMYLVFDSRSRDALLVDVGGDPSEALSWVQRMNLKLRALLATHGHFDHVIGLPQLRDFKLSTYIHRSDLDTVRLSVEWYSRYTQARTEIPEFNSPVEGDTELKIGTIELVVLHTPGHSPGSTSIYIPSAEVLLSGDTLFAGTVGRTDLPGGSEENLRESIKKIYERVPLDVVVYPGHGPQTTLRRELRANPFVEDALGYPP
ncbi:MAG: MBL fold metallo-hydrolase [Sulfolobales archaeon]|nr:MBL fold metallo-hydrolase [Sulfolobales archaeon]MDW8082942.1 MBL fold metallo-hydrolase [Sulfolobales archaeon]